MSDWEMVRRDIGDEAADEALATYKRLAEQEPAIYADKVTIFL